MEIAPVTLRQRLEPEDLARAEFYALLARLFGGGPDASLLAALGGSNPWPEAVENPLASAWNRLILASGVMDPDAAEQAMRTHLRHALLSIQSEIKQSKPAAPAKSRGRLQKA